MGWTPASEAAVAESKRSPARGLAEEQWSRAIEELRVAANDLKEPRRDEALYGSHTASISSAISARRSSLRQLERRFPSSTWVKEGGSLRIEIAWRLNRHDVLWWTAVWSPESVPPGAKPAARAAGDACARHEAAAGTCASDQDTARRDG
jgi:hypothetical protein